MAKTKVLDLKGTASGELELRDDVFDIEPNMDVMYRYVDMQLTNRRQGTAHTKTRSEVKGSGQKPYPQKHTGRARQGSMKGPHQRHGGVAFGPRTRNWKKNLPKKMKKLALKSALSTRYREGNLVVVDDFKMENAKTKTFADTLKALNIGEEKCLVVLPYKTDEYINTKTSGRNLSRVKVLIADNPGSNNEKNTIDGLNVFDLVNNTKVVLTREMVKKIEEVLGHGN